MVHHQEVCYRIQEIWNNEIEKKLQHAFANFHITFPVFWRRDTLSSGQLLSYKLVTD